jgi:3-phenylpropionate/trans-cinnamate dioxygenase ferredoxin reductase component
MEMQHRTHVIVGASLAGASAAEALRKEGFDGRIILVGEEPHRPYERPELSKKYLRGVPDTDVFVHPAQLYADAAIELWTGQRVDRIDVREREVTVDGDTIRFDRLLLATGAAPRTLSVPGGSLSGVVTLRTIDDADRVRDLAGAASSIVVVGGGWIGSEVAASLRRLGHEVTLVVGDETPLQRVLGPEVGSVYLDAHQRHGTRVVLGRRVVAVDGRERVTNVRLDDGRALAADLVVVGIGVRPRDELAAEAGLAIANGVLVDEHLETSEPGIFAAGDVASAFHPRYGRHLRVEHWDNARRQGRAAAANMLGRGTTYERVPYFYSDQYDLSMEYVGHASDWDRVVLRGDPAEGAFVAFWLRGGRLAAAMQVNTGDAMPHLRKLVAAEAAIGPGLLADVARPLGELVAPSGVS